MTEHGHGDVEQQTVLLVGVCTGQRCDALRRLSWSASPTGTGAEPDASPAGSYDLIRSAIRTRPEAVLVTLPCLGPCHHGSVTAVGNGLAARNSLTWVGRPRMIGLSQTHERAQALADWIGADAPSTSTVPEALRRPL